jgi:hypothetical protein
MATKAKYYRHHNAQSRLRTNPLLMALIILLSLWAMIAA